MHHHPRRLVVVISLLVLFTLIAPVAAQGGAGTKDFPIRDFGACINLPDFTVVTEPDEFNTLYTVPGLFEINFAEYLMPLAALPNTSDDIYNAMIALLDTVNAGDYVRIAFDHPQYISAAVEFTLDGKRMFGMIYRNQDDKLFFLFADKVEGFDMLAIGRAIFAADTKCQPLPGFEYPAAASAETAETTGTTEFITETGPAGNIIPQAGEWTYAENAWMSGSCSDPNYYYEPWQVTPNIYPDATITPKNDFSFVYTDDDGTLTMEWNPAGGYYTADISGGLSPDIIMPSTDRQGAEFRLRVISPTHIEGEIMIWAFSGGLQCNVGQPVVITKN